MAKINAVDAFCDRYGILKSWIADNIGVSIQYLRYALLERGLSSRETLDIENLLHSKGQELLRFKFSGNHKADIEHLRETFGIKKSWLAEQLGMSSALLALALDRQAGLREDEIELAIFALHDVGRAFMSFEMPQSLQKAA